VVLGVPEPSAVTGCRAFVEGLPPPQRQQQQCGLSGGQPGGLTKGRRYSASTIVTLAIPPPSHIVCNPYFFFRARNACTSVAISFVPVAPSG
jgi:hypothetical protein